MAKAKLRAAKFGDIPELTAMLAEAHGRSRYADLPFSETRTKALLMAMIQRQGGNVEGSTLCAVVEREDGLQGFILALLQSFYQVFDVLEATDLFFYARPDAHPTTAMRLLRAMHRWAAKCDGPYIIRQGNSDIITDFEKTGRLFERAGMRRSGAIYEKGHTK